MYGFPQNSKFDILRDVSFALAIENPSGFHTILSAAATHMDAIHGRNPGRRAIWHRLEAICLLNQQLADPVLSVSDNTIVTISSLMATEVSSLPVPQENEMHVN
jgi:Fungal specific transcription factor domain